MKINLARKALLLVAVALGLSTVVPAQAMETSADVNTQVAAKTGLFSGLSKDALQKRLNSTMKTLNRQWASFMKCAKGKGCTFSQKAVIVTSLTTIMAIVALLGGHKLDDYTRGYAGAPGRYVSAKYNEYQNRKAEAAARKARMKLYPKENLE